MVTRALTSNVQTVEETGDFLPAGFDAGDEGQRRPEESVALLGETQENYSGVSIQVFYWKGGKKRQKITATKLFFSALKLHKSLVNKE